MLESDLIPVRVKNSWGYINRRGKMVIQPRFSAAGRFSCGLGCVCEGGESTYTGDVVGGRWGYINEAGEYAGKLRFSEASDFSEGLAVVNVGARVEYAAKEDRYYQLGGLYGFVDTALNWEMEPSLYYADSFSEGLALGKNSNGEGGYLDLGLHWKIEPRFHHGYRFREGITAVDTSSRGQNWTYIDKSGAIITDLRFYLAYNFSEGIAVGLDRNYRFHFLDRQFHELFQAPPNTMYTGRFSNGLVWLRVGQVRQFGDDYFPVGGDHHNLGFMNARGEWAIPMQFDQAHDFHEGLACVQLDGKWGFIGTDGEWVVPPISDIAGDFSGGLAAIEVDGRFTLIHPDGSPFWEG